MCPLPTTSISAVSADSSRPVNGSARGTSRVRRVAGGSAAPSASSRTWWRRSPGLPRSCTPRRSHSRRSSGSGSPSCSTSPGKLCGSSSKPTWASPGSYLSTALIGEIAVWRAANGISPHDPRPTGGIQLQTAPALWKQRLDRDIARATTADARADKPHTGRTALSPRDVRRRPYQQPERRPSGLSAPGR
jgi:hypothetical protein